MFNAIIDMKIFGDEYSVLFSAAFTLFLTLFSWLVRGGFVGSLVPWGERDQNPSEPNQKRSLAEVP